MSLAWLPLALLAISPQPALPQQTRREKMAVFGYDVLPDFVRFDPGFRSRIDGYKQRLEKLSEAVYAKDLDDGGTACSHQLLVEAHWLTYYTADYKRIEAKLGQLAALVENQRSANHPRQASDGSYGPCHDAWFYRLDATCDYLVNDEKPKLPLKFLDQVNSKEKLLAYLNHNLVSDIARTGEDRRFELNLGATDLLRLVNGHLPSGYSFKPEVRKAMLDWVNGTWQDPKTGFFGAWYRTPNGIRKTADISCTFHVVDYTDGQVKRWPQIVNTVLAMRDLEFPFGWLQEGKLSNHHNMDIVKLFRHGWTFLTAAQKKTVKVEIRRMLDHCLKETLNPDGSFNREDMNSLGEAYLFPVSFLAETGYFHREYRFWTKEDFPGSAALAHKIVKKMKELKLRDPESQTALWILETADGY